MLALEAKLPGFGGFFIDADHEVVAYAKKTLPHNHARVREILAKEFSLHPSGLVRRIMAPAGRARILEGSYSLSELIAIENRIWNLSPSIQGFSGVGTSIVDNKVQVEFVDSLSMRSGLDAMRQLNVPLEALKPRASGRARLTSDDWPNITSFNQPTFFGAKRPIPDGATISVGNFNVHQSFNSARGTLGYNILNYGTKYLLTAAHIEVFFEGEARTITGDTVFQPDRLFDSYHRPVGGQVAIISNNPHWPENTGCGYPYCITADAMLASYISGYDGIRRVLTSWHEGLHGDPGSAALNQQTPYEIDSVLEPEYMVQHNYTYGIHKSGGATFTTTGIFSIPNFQIVFQICLDALTIPSGCPSNRKRTVALNGAVFVDGALSSEGDSGAPVFAGDGHPYKAVGILNGGNGCPSSDNCYFFLSKWSAIEAWFGLGPLDPRTAGSPPPPSGPAVAVIGPDSARTGNDCLFSVSTGNAVQPLTYQWVVNGTLQPQTDEFFRYSGSSDYDLEISITDANGTQWWATHPVVVDGAARVCVDY